MPVTLKFQSSGTMPGNARPIQMQGGSLTVGRGPANDLVLPDPDRTLSKSHCVIEDHNGNIVIVDLSSNGTFLNYSKIPLGRTPTPLNNGDVLALGSYELLVEISDDLPDIDDLIAAPAAQGSVSPGRAENAPDPMALLDDAGPEGDFLDDLLGGSNKPTGPSQLNPVDPIDELLPPIGDEEDPFFGKPDDGRGDGPAQPMHNPSGQDAFSPQGTGQGAGQSLIPEDWDDDFLNPDPPAAAPPPQPSVVPAPQSETPPGNPPENQPEPPADPDAEPTTVPAAAERPDPPSRGATPPSAAEREAAQPAAPQPAATGDDALLRAFLEALGAEGVQLADEDPARTMARMGRVMKTLVTGMREILMTRTSIKSEFRIEQTMISAGGNNPLKFSVSPEQAIEAMVKPAARGYLGPESAAEQALDDIKAHEVAMLTGMEAALRGVLLKLDPEVLAGRIETSGALGSLLKGKKARYWEVYEKMYADISDQAENDFHDLFSREFARAYSEQLQKLK
ncbi:type VI secretion system-associated FHA domain protein TagH [Pukyongiella litopenaei]|uniref:Type VI secretion system-associated FHA domain protein TagH n=1 Tax=Pukyongiella litopenaei TaxID=2605946 RepID=A0A2S0MP70_9RHOB|nr:type VI secretion system-associated FHA domain protein TagH [Pukyongiella litopenaei]AVO37680.1 type VI secretion system-associated FHA domain protein TagH [Pukyongiella litopenaei]